MSNGPTNTAQTSNLKDITKISKTDFLNLPLSEQMKYVDRSKLSGMVSSNKTRNALMVEYGSQVADEIMSLNISDKDKIKYAKKYQSTNQVDMNNDFNFVYNSLHNGTGFYPIGEQPAYDGLTADDFYEKYATLLGTFNQYESASFYKMYSDLQKFETEQYKHEVKIAKDLDTVNEEFHSDVEEQFKRVGNIQEVNDIFQTVLWTTESFFEGGAPGDQTDINLDVSTLKKNLNEDLAVYGDVNTSAWMNSKTGEYHVPNLHTIKEYESILDKIVSSDNFVIPTGHGGDSWMMEYLGDNIDPAIKKAFQTGNEEAKKIAWKKAMLNKIVSARQKLYGTIPLALVDNNEFNTLLKEDWQQNFKGVDNDPFLKYKKQPNQDNNANSYLNQPTPEGLTGEKRKAWYDQHGWEYDSTIEVIE